MSNNDITIMIDSASRPNLLIPTLTSLWEHIKYTKGNIKWVFHEAILFPEESIKNIDYANRSKMFDKIHTQQNPKGEGCSINTILQMCDTKYFMHWEDDYIALRDVPVNKAVEIMDINQNVNQIVFNRRDTMPDCSGWVKKVYTKAGHAVTTSPHWRITPALWRVDFIRPKWRAVEGGNFHWVINGELQSEFKDCKEGKTAEWINEKLGTFYLGGIDEKAYCKHTGQGQSNRT